MVGEKKSLHPAFTVTNIKTLIPILLDIKQDEHSSWFFLFELHLQAHNLVFLIHGSATRTDLDATTVKHLDSLCRQWMFSTMAKGFMLTVLKSGKTAKGIWDHLKKLFQDNKGIRAATLEIKFVNLKFTECNGVDDYCDKLKLFSDRLSDLDFPMNDKRLVTQLVNGLTEEYNTVASFIQQSMPSFDSARSQLRTEEIRRSQQTLSSTPTTLAAAASPVHRNNQRQNRPNSNRRGPRPPSHGNDWTQNPAAQPPLLPTSSMHQTTQPTPGYARQPSYPPYWPPYWHVPPFPYSTAPAWQPRRPH
ncbi:uncharacterized protein LOC113362673 [Papaver somniferum]|uniref:uncharacterized protein LOC113362673 n=1 Tax=Papaver somniferum TaxID=3469 RepID=UPI000E7016D8|nr:uncharacterized protein LOC113362673 [Papaver somniferum]